VAADDACGIVRGVTGLHRCQATAEFASTGSWPAVMNQSGASDKGTASGTIPCHLGGA
jgi:hypothetical protein